ncbi:RPAB2 [Enterospora canceri]|uniref:RPAB2 n=1 Tax=Enterospora canceri TaxID=1081671 RepID=A0A1Y1S701_9MICR|nr:RPAB2 [Enterospora canceri]
MAQDERVTSNRMTIYEKAKIIGVRACQLGDDAVAFVDVTGMTDAMEIAKKELNEKKLPYIIRRKLPDGSHEDWKLSEMLIPDVDYD